jgi:hypothetical protein
MMTARATNTRSRDTVAIQGPEVFLRTLTMTNTSSYLHWLVAVGCEVLSLQADQQAAPQAGGHSDEQVPV